MPRDAHVQGLHLDQRLPARAVQGHVSADAHAVAIGQCQIPLAELLLPGVQGLIAEGEQETAYLLLVGFQGNAQIFFSPQQHRPADADADLPRLDDCSGIRQERLPKGRAKLG